MGMADVSEAGHGAVIFLSENTVGLNTRISVASE